MWLAALKLIPGALSLGSWIKGNPGKAANNTVIYIAMAAIAAGGAFLWWDYQDAKSDRARLRVELEATQQLTVDQEAAITSFVEAEREYAALIREVEQFRGDLADELDELRRGLSANEIREAAAQDAQIATTDTVALVNRGFRLFDDATDPREPDPDAE